MEKYLLNSKVLSKWIILLIDQVIISWAFSLSFFVIKRFEFSEILRGHYAIYLGLYCLVSVSVFYAMRIHTGIIRYSSIYDIFRIFSAVLNVSIIYWIIVNYPLAYVANLSIDISEINTALIVNFFISSATLIILRIGVKGFFTMVKNNAGNIKKEVILIYGSDQSSLLIKKALEATDNGKLNIAGFIDHDRNKISKYIEQKRVYHLSDIKYLKDKLKVEKMLVVEDKLKTEGERKIIETCIELGIRVFTVPPTSKWLYGQLRINQLHDLKIEDLLQREPIVIQKNNILAEVAGKRILVTGAAGSIGSEIVRQIMHYAPQEVILCDQAESPLHELQLEIEDNHPDAKMKIYIANIQNYERMHSMFENYRPHMVFHAAAYKHVPMMENNPSEAILTNVLGTKNLADLSIDFDVDKFIMISTDKAVNPTNVMGASKRIAEIYIQSLSSKYDGDKFKYSKTPKTKFITTRFGNVLGSNGSVIPRFRKQIDAGGPLTVTHPAITRYFMTIPEAVQLVLEAGAMGKGGEIFIFDMGKPVKIVDLAEKMIRLAGLIPNEDIKIVFTGLRPGEKLYEELLNKEEHDIPTHNEKIKISSVITYPYSYVSKMIGELLSHNQQEDDFGLVRKMKEIVPEYKSNNSKFEKIDSVLSIKN